MLDIFRIYFIDFFLKISCIFGDFFYMYFTMVTMITSEHKTMAKKGQKSLRALFPPKVQKASIKGVWGHSF